MIYLIQKLEFVPVSCAAEDIELYDILALRNQYSYFR